MILISYGDDTRKSLADDAYVSALRWLTVGQLKLSICSYNTDPVDGAEIRQIEFQVEFDDTLKPSDLIRRSNARSHHVLPFPSELN